MRDVARFLILMVVSHGRGFFRSQFFDGRAGRSTSTAAGGEEGNREKEVDPVLYL